MASPRTVRLAVDDGRVPVEPALGLLASPDGD
jgi:hypothetical protein